MTSRSGFPTGAGVLLGLGLGGFFDGIVLHQLLQWHHMVSGWYPPTTLENLRLNAVWDGIFHAATYVLVVLGVYGLWRGAPTDGRRHGRAFAGTLLLGWGVFNVVEGLIDHQWLGLHHVKEIVPREQWLAWDLGFLAWGAAMVVGGILLLRADRRAP